MMKAIILLVLVLGVFSQRQNERVRLDYYNQLVLPAFTSTQTTGDVTVKINSHGKTADTGSITVQLREISDLNNPLSSTIVSSQTCTLSSNACSVVFTAPTLSSANKYTIRLDDPTAFHDVAVNVQLAIITSTSTIHRSVRGQVLVSPEGATNPGFKFYVGTAGLWNAYFNISSSPAPTVTSYDFTLWSVNGNTLTSYSTLSLSAAGSLSFSIGATGYYFVTVSLEISTIDSTAKYPITLDFNYGSNVCQSGQFYNRTSKACVACSTVANSLGTTTHQNICDCATNYYWNEGTEKCVACPTKGCPSNNQNHGQPNQHFGGAQNIIQQFNNGNLRSSTQQGHK